ncbi:MAG TPA: TIGR02147 family protein [Bdellovibrio sp.]|nr:TIGR02147 family protein [Bdellovibrio sp.]
MKTVQVFDFKSYRTYLAEALDQAGKAQRGVRGKFAAAIRCQPSYVSQVLKGTSELTLEQADRASQFMGHMDEQSEYFLMLVCLARAGTEPLRKQLERMVDKAHSSYWRLQNRLSSKGFVTEEAKRLFYSNWQYSAVHIAVTVPGLRTPERIAERLQIPLKQAREALHFLTQIGLVKTSGREHVPGEQWLHTGNDRELAVRDHLNWRVKAISSLDNFHPANLHYSSVVSISAGDFDLVRARLIKALEDLRGIIKESKEEKVCSLLLDFFEL